MNDNKILNEEIISDIILCEPITRKGKEALDRLNLTADISISFFYSNLRVPSKYDRNKTYINKPINCDCLYYQYTVDRIQFETLKEQLEKFDSRFYSDSPNEYPLLMLGVAGNGKSIEINRRIHEAMSEESESEFNLGKAYFDLEDAFTKITYGNTYECPNNNPLWLFCIKLLDGIMRYIKSNYLSCSKILENFNNIVVPKNLANEKQRKLFQNIGNYFNGNNDKETEVFCSLISLLSSENAKNNIKTLLETLMWIMYCSAPNKKQYVVIDNIEQYIKLNTSRIQIPNSDISKIYDSINEVVMNMTYAFGRIEKDLGWKAFKIIIVLRRTSFGLLGSTLLHSPVKEEQNITDITGHFQIPDIWEKKKKYVWDKKLRNKFNNHENEIIMNIVEIIMNEGVQAIGTDYQSIIAPLMSYGIRRNAKAQAHAAYSTYKMLTNEKRENINYNEFNKLISTLGQDTSSNRYMFRRALIEFQFKWSISSGRPDRWKNLGIGHLTGEKEYSYNGKKFIIENVDYCDTKCVTLLRRILTYLSYFPEEHNEYVNNQHKLVVDMFSTKSLFDLMKGVFTTPLGQIEILKDDFLQFSRVLIALSDMSNGDTKSAPFVILGINDRYFHENTNEIVLAELLKKIWDAGEENSLPGKKYGCNDFGVRITDAGNSFLLDWQASFSFMASLYCFTIPPLFFLKDIFSIRYVIKTVYEKSSELCEMYENEAERFCGEDVNLKTGKYLPEYKGKLITFKQRVKELHINHLNLYRDFIQKNYRHMGISEYDMLNLTSVNLGFISKYIEKYTGWETIEGAPECF